MSASKRLELLENRAVIDLTSALHESIDAGADAAWPHARARYQDSEERLLADATSLGVGDGTLVAPWLLAIERFGRGQASTGDLRAALAGAFPFRGDAALVEMLAYLAGEADAVVATFTAGSGETAQ